MGYSKVKLFQNTKFYSNQNYKIDSIEEFLTTLSSSVTPPIVFDSVQYFKPMSIDKELKLTCPQKDIKDFHKYNYARIELISESGASEVVDWILYYFVMKVEWISSGAVKLTLRMDTLNTFMDTMIFSPRTMVEREHIDRWRYDVYKKDTDNNKITLLRDIPYTNEGLNPNKYACNITSTCEFEYNPNYSSGNRGQNIISHSFAPALNPNRSWYVIYHYDTTNEYYPLYIVDRGSAYIKHYSDENYHVLGLLSNVKLDMASSIKIAKLPYAPVEDLDVSSSSSSPITDTATSVFVITNIDNPDSSNKLWGISINKNDLFTGASRLYNLINKYIQYGTEFQLIKFKSLSKRIFCVCDISYADISSNIKNNGVFKQNNYSNESSLYSSEFLNIRFSLENNNFDISLEDFDFKGTQTDFNLVIDDSRDNDFIGIYYYVPYLMGQAYSFEFIGRNGMNYLLGNSVNNILIINANTQVPQFESQYINYMRNGYNYDVKLIENTREKRGFEFSKSMSLKGANYITFNPSKMARTAYESAIEYADHEQEEMYNRINEDLQMEKKISELKGSRINVLDSQTSLDMNRVSNDSYKLQLSILTPMKEFWNTISNYFYYYGNKVRQYKVPTHNNRALFDYLKCEADFINRNNVPNSECYNDIIERLKNGVTFIHKYLNTWTFDTDYKENVENGLLAIL